MCRWWAASFRGRDIVPGRSTQLLDVISEPPVTRMRRNIVEIGIAIAMGTVLFGAVYLPLVNGYFESIEVPLLYVFAPAIVIGSAVGGGFDRAGTVAGLVGVIGEVLVLWLVIRIVRTIVQRSRVANDV